MTMDKANKPATLTIEMRQEDALDNKGKPVKDPSGEKHYLRDDYVGLLRLLNRFDSKMHQMSDLKQFIKVKDKLLAAWPKEQKTIDLSLDNASFLKKYLSEFQANEGKESKMAEFEMRTLVGILEQLEPQA